MQGVVASQWENQQHYTVLAAGAPKGAGKTTLALSSTTPSVVVSCDLGKLSIPPGVDRTQILVLPYHELTREMKDQGATVPVKDVYMRLTRDLYSIYTAVKSGQPLKQDNGEVFPTPKTIVLDGVSRLNNMLIDGLCALNNITEPVFGKGDKGSAFKFWGQRLRGILTIVEQFASLNCNVILTTWIDQQKDGEGNFTGVWLPDIGGKMDLLAAGTVDAALYCYSRQGRFYVRTKGDGMYPWCGVRDRYSLAAEIDVTIEMMPDGKNVKGQLPFQKIFGN